MKTHPLNVTYLVIGLVFLGISGSWALRQAGVIDTADVNWLGPVALIVAGGVGLVAAVAKSLKRDSATSSYSSEYQGSYDAPLPQDYTSDIDRKLDEAATAVIPATGTDTRSDTGSEPTTVIPTDDDTKDENR